MNYKKLLLICAVMFFVCAGVLVGCNDGTQDPTPPEATLTILQPFETNYFVGDDLDISGGVLKYTDEEDNTETVSITTQMVKGFSSSKPGTRTLYIEYKSISTTVQYTVSPYDIVLNQNYISSSYVSSLYRFVPINSDIIRVEYITTPSALNKTYTALKKFDNDGFIEYSFTINSQNDKEGIIFDITKNSFKLRDEYLGTTTLWQISEN